MELNTIRDLINILNNYPYIKDKKYIAGLLNIQSIKKDELLYELYKRLRDIRKNKETFDFLDIKDFHNIPEKIDIKIENESEAFLEYYKEYLFSKVKEIKNYETKMNNYNTRDWNYYMNRIEKDKISEYKKIEKHLQKLNKESIKVETKLFILFDKLYDGSKEFYKNLLNNMINKYTNIYHKKVAKYEKLKELAQDKNYVIAHPGLNREITKLKLVATKYSLDDYLKIIKKETEEKFKYDMMDLCNRIITRYPELNINNLEILCINKDMKLFDITITDGNIKINGRAILCALYSTKMVTHYRFILS